jgi:hypothetical protein
MTTKLFLALAAALQALRLTPPPAPAQVLGAATVIAPVPLAGFPEGIATRGNRFRSIDQHL